jgi:hypothetical protein
MVSMAGPAGYHFSTGAGAALTRGRAGKVPRSPDSGLGILMSEKATARQITNRNVDDNLRFVNRKIRRLLLLRA